MTSHPRALHPAHDDTGSLFRFEKHRVGASITLASGEEVRGFFFVVSSLTADGRDERVGDLLNSEDGFFPFQRADGGTSQYNRRHVVLVRLPAGLAEERLEPDYAACVPRPVTMTLSPGLSVEGAVLVAAAAGHERLSDFVRDATTFIYVVTTGGTLIANTHHVVALVERTD